MNIKDPTKLLSDDPIIFNKNKIKLNLMILIVNIVKGNNWTRKQASHHLQISESRISNLMNGKVSQFTVDALIEMLIKLNHKINVSFNPQNILEPISIKFFNLSAKFC